MSNHNETPDLPTVLEECAEHIRAGRDPRDYYRGAGSKRDVVDEADIVELAIAGQLGRKPQTITINGVEVPAPEISEPNDRYWCLTDALSGDWEARERWVDSQLDRDRLQNGQVYLNKSDRDQAAQAIIKALRGEHD